MANQKVGATAKIKNEAGEVTGEKSVEVDYDFGDNLADATKKFGEDVVFSNFKQSAVIGLQGVLRRAIQGGNDAQEAATKWVPGMKTVTRKSASEKVKDAFGSMSEEERKELLKQLKTM